MDAPNFYLGFAGREPFWPKALNMSLQCSEL